MKINLLQLSLIASLMGIFFLLTLVTLLPPKSIEISSITKKHLDQNILLSGEVFNTRTFEESEFQLINIKDKSGSIIVTLDNPIKISKNQRVTVVGKVAEYNKTLQIQASKIINVSSP